MVKVYEFQLSDGTPVGCGTKAEMDYWTAEGVFEGYKLGKVIGQEPAAKDAKRAAMWAKG